MKVRFETANWIDGGFHSLGPYFEAVNMHFIIDDVTFYLNEVCKGKQIYVPKIVWENSQQIVCTYFL